MKKRLLIGLIVLFIGGLVFTGCEICTTCTESVTQRSSEYCGKKSDVEAFEDDYKTTGALVGQSWTCTRD